MAGRTRKEITRKFCFVWRHDSFAGKKSILRGKLVIKQKGNNCAIIICFTFQKKIIFYSFVTSKFAQIGYKIPYCKSETYISGIVIDIFCYIVIVLKSRFRLIYLCLFILLKIRFIINKYK